MDSFNFEVESQEAAPSKSLERAQMYRRWPMVALCAGVLVLIATSSMLAASPASKEQVKQVLPAMPTRGIAEDWQRTGCPASPELHGEDLASLVADNKGVLIIANPQMRCTIAVRAALDSKATAYTFKPFTAPFEYTEGTSTVWDWLHCNYPDDLQGTRIIHSYVFLDSTFIGQGFAAAAKIQSGEVSLPAAHSGPTCEERFADQADVVRNFMAINRNRVLLFGWLACPCTAMAQERFHEVDLCYQSRVWANPTERLMEYLQCKEGRPQDHSFVYFRKSSGNSEWHYAGNGFQFAANAMTQPTFDGLVSNAHAEKTCHAASVKVNLYGEPLEECRVGHDNRGSWQDDGTCSEQIGGVHQICIEGLPADFSTATHQTAWSETRAGKRHCVCVGAWSLYMTDAHLHPDHARAIMPHCKAIPETALTSRYLQHWKAWNGYPASVVSGVGELVGRCLTQANSSTTQEDAGVKAKMLCGLRHRFQKLEKTVSELKDADELNSLHSRLQSLTCTETDLESL